MHLSLIHISKAWTEGFYNKPRVDLELLKLHHEGLIALSACLAGEIPRNIVSGDFEEAKAAADAAIRAHFTGDLLGQSVTLAQLGHMLYALDEVENYHFTSPSADVAAEVTQLPRLGALTITDMEGA